MISNILEEIWVTISLCSCVCLFVSISFLLLSFIYAFFWRKQKYLSYKHVYIQTDKNKTCHFQYVLLLPRPDVGKARVPRPSVPCHHNVQHELSQEVKIERSGRAQQLCHQCM